MKYLTLLMLIFSACSTSPKDPLDCEKACAPDISEGIVMWNGKKTCFCLSKSLHDQLEELKRKKSI